MHYYQFNIKSYCSDTAHLSNEEDLAYRRLLDLYYDTEQPITQNIPSLSRRLRVGLQELEIVLNEYFVLSENGWVNSHCEHVIREMNAFVEKQRINGKLGGRPKKTQALAKQNPKEPNVKPPITNNQLPITNNKEQIHTPEKAASKKTASQLPDGFSVSQSVEKWATENGHGRLAERLEYFTGYAKSSGKKYADWDQAFMNSIRDDWAKLGKVAPKSDQGWSKETKSKAFLWKMSGFPMEEFVP